MSLREDETTYPFWIDRGEDARAVRVGLSERWIETLAAPLVGLELMPSGTRLRPGDSLGLLHTSEGTLDLALPFGGEVAAVNEAVGLDPGLIRRSPYHRGWLMDIERLED